MNPIFHVSPTRLLHLSRVKTPEMVCTPLWKKPAVVQQSIDFSLQMLIQRQARQQSGRL